MTVTITLEAMKFYAFHGVTEEERMIGGAYLVDISYAIKTDAVETDRIEQTINYADIYDLTKEEMMKPSLLIEHVAGRLLKVLKNKFPQAQEMTVKISKLNPPVNGEMAKATVSMK
ncbi:MAG: dihydroneopterin aldolase [Tannerella sp.]|jgi:dihydroneopterin aldolase|nr:dihydroneopterin aldolase [Tannerella sp.]